MDRGGPSARSGQTVRADERRRARATPCRRRPRAGHPSPKRRTLRVGPERRPYSADWGDGPCPLRVSAPADRSPSEPRWRAAGIASPPSRSSPSGSPEQQRLYLRRIARTSNGNLGLPRTSATGTVHGQGAGSANSRTIRRRRRVPAHSLARRSSGSAPGGTSEAARPRCDGRRWPVRRRVALAVDGPLHGPARPGAIPPTQPRREATHQTVAFLRSALPIYMS